MSKNLLIVGALTFAVMVGVLMLHRQGRTDGNSVIPTPSNSSLSSYGSIPDADSPLSIPGTPAVTDQGELTAQRNDVSPALVNDSPVSLIEARSPESEIFPALKGLLEEAENPVLADILNRHERHLSSATDAWSDNMHAALRTFMDAQPRAPTSDVQSRIDCRAGGCVLQVEEVYRPNAEVSVSGQMVSALAEQAWMGQLREAASTNLLIDKVRYYYIHFEQVR